LKRVGSSIVAFKQSAEDRADTRHGHEPVDLRVITCQLQNLTIEIVGLLLDGLTCLEQRSHHSDQLRTILDQFLDPHGKDIELGTADHQTNVLEATDLVLEIPLDPHEQRPARQQRFDRMIIEILDANLFEPAGLSVMARSLERLGLGQRRP
jgi:hypothetical protein